MARKVIWSYEATEDLDALAEYIAKDSLFYAAAVAQEILDVSRSLNDFSERGRIVPELGNPKIRELIIRDYRLIYSIEQVRVVIVALVHGARDLKALWEKGNGG
ncbi:type II toxin-antitoxin system RelE/ParE family toxin [candidate division TA06 bacterium]|uniref:Type II toxin-antitoxin system RelE/ParE family toxin n=1 Tax=candidate division TA06 bacterium TaxID=2250710 RepID=A0A933I6V7_UNCT6|nr:type II toxin-antitoxin system RelE/ParE family toxin [candidate division TA06 bacterium]